MRIAVIGVGYVGLVTAACLAELGHSVLAIDSDLERISMLRRGIVPFVEPDLQPLVRRHLDEGRLRFDDDPAHACHDVELIFIAVGTPALGRGFADLGYVMSVAREIGKHLRDPVTIVVKSTVPPGTCDRIKAEIEQQIARRAVEIPIDVLSNPEFLREGSAVRDFLVPDRIVVGASRPEAAAILDQLYTRLVASGSPLLIMDLASAEFAKYAANAMLATRISLVNELATIAEAVGGDFSRVREVIATDYRIGPHFLDAGIGYGGSCFPKDMRALARIALQHGVEARLLIAAEQANADAKRMLVDKITDWYGDTSALRGKVIAIWGLSFKPGTDDMREAPSQIIVNELLAVGVRVRAHDPAARVHAQQIWRDQPNLAVAVEPLEALHGADALAVVTEWPEYRSIAPIDVARALADRVVFDGRNALDASAYREAGIRVIGVGKRGPEAGSVTASEQVAAEAPA